MIFLTTTGAAATAATAATGGTGATLSFNRQERPTSLPVLSSRMLM